MKVLIELPEIEGFGYTGEYRKAKEGEWFLGATGEPIEASPMMCEPRPLLKKIELKYNSYFMNGNEYVEIKALEDTLKLLDCVIMPLWSIETRDRIKKLRELIK